MAVPIYIPTNSAQNFLFLYVCQQLLSFWGCSSNSCVLILWVWLTFPWLVCVVPFYVAIGHLNVLGKTLEFLYPIFRWCVWLFFVFFPFWSWVILSSSCTLDNKSSDIEVVNFFSHCIGWLFILMISFAVQKLFGLILIPLIFSFGIISKKSLPRLMWSRFFPIFSSRNLTVLSYLVVLQICLNFKNFYWNIFELYE